MIDPYGLIDPLGYTFMQKALGQGQLTDEDLQKILRSPNSPFGQAGMGAGGGLGMGQIAPVQAPQPVGHANFGPSGKGPDKDIIAALLGGGNTYQTSQGPIPSSVGVTGAQGLGSGSSALRMAGK